MLHVMLFRVYYLYYYYYYCCFFVAVVEVKWISSSTSFSSSSQLSLHVYRIHPIIINCSLCVIYSLNEINVIEWQFAQSSSEIGAVCCGLRHMFIGTQRKNWSLAVLRWRKGRRECVCCTCWKHLTVGLNLISYFLIHWQF